MAYTLSFQKKVKSVYEDLLKIGWKPFFLKPGINNKYIMDIYNSNNAYAKTFTSAGFKNENDLRVKKVDRKKYYSK